MFPGVLKLEGPHMPHLGHLGHAERQTQSRTKMLLSADSINRLVLFSTEFALNAAAADASALGNFLITLTYVFSIRRKLSMCVTATQVALHTSMLTLPTVDYISTATKCGPQLLLLTLF